MRLIPGRMCQLAKEATISPVTSSAPVISVVIPTYNRSNLLGRTLEALAAQRFPVSEFEVIVADDGSCDDTRDVVRSFENRLRLRYFYQPDEGFRAGTARNEGARRAEAPVLLFLDTGMLAGTSFIAAHHEAHRTTGSARGRVILGYAYGYNRFDPYPDLDRVLVGLRPEEAVARLGGDERFRDMRHARFDRVDFDLTRLVAPWWLFWSLNVSVDTESFWAVGGFDEDFRSWGLEDVELGYRLTQHGVPMFVSREAWVVDYPHERSVAAENTSSLQNARLFLDKHLEPIPEMLWARYAWTPRMNFEDACRELVAWTEKAHDRQVSAEIADALREPFAAEHDPPRVAVFGCGGELPDTLPAGAALVDFDEELLRRAVGDGPHAGIHGIGLQTRCPEGSFDLVVITSRLAGLWDRWGEAVLAEAQRIGRTVRTPFRPDAG